MTAERELIKGLVEAIRWHFRPLAEDYVGKPAAHAKNEVLARAEAWLAGHGEAGEGLRFAVTVDVAADSEAEARDYLEGSLEYMREVADDEKRFIAVEIA